METCCNQNSAMPRNHSMYGTHGNHCSSKPNYRSNPSMKPAGNCQPEQHHNHPPIPKEEAANQFETQFPIAMAYVPWQKWGELYDYNTAIKQGTIFKDLNKVFCGVRC